MKGICRVGMGARSRANSSGNGGHSSEPRESQWGSFGGQEEPAGGTSDRVAATAAALLSEAAWVELARCLNFSAREFEIVRGVFDNRTEAAIAADLGISGHTVHAHLNRLYVKLRVTTRLEMVLRVIKAFLLLTTDEATRLPPICSNQAKGCCPLSKPVAAGPSPTGACCLSAIRLTPE